ncbi:MAG: hypothetical protein EU550_00195 [Promethearchaeota archaeon]|nr:MAG: hypothetical protein EU550_00195 [Candidatus Lokiarchaeota archaeon]
MSYKSKHSLMPGNSYKLINSDLFFRSSTVISPISSAENSELAAIKKPSKPFGLKWNLTI